MSKYHSRMRCDSIGFLLLPRMPEFPVEGSPLSQQYALQSLLRKDTDSASIRVWRNLVVRVGGIQMLQQLERSDASSDNAKGRE